MPMKDVRLVATIAAVGILVCFSTSEQTAAAPSAKPAASPEKPVVLAKLNKRRAHTAKKSRTARYARKSSSKSSATKSDESKVAEKKAAASKPELPTAVANAHAEATKPRTLADDEARNLAALDSTDVVSNVDGVQVTGSDQLNDVDRALTEESAPALVAAAAAPVAAEPIPANKVIKAVPSGEKPTVKKADDSDPWSKSSLLGKLFIAFGGLLTLASAARILIA